MPYLQRLVIRTYSYNRRCNFCELFVADPMLDSVLHLFRFGVVEAVDRAYQVSSDPADPFELDTFSDFAIYTLYLVS